MPAPKVRSKDSAQQRLRDHKRQWNSTYRDFSQRLKAFKDGINGRGNAKIGLPPSNIKEPMPGEVGSYLSQLAGEFQKIVGDAESIIAEQEQYSRTRRRRKPKAPGAPVAAPNPAPEGVVAPEAPPAPEQDKVVENLSRLGRTDYELVVEASNRLTRFWQYATAIFSRKEFNKQRIGLLTQAADIFYSLRDVEDSVLSLHTGEIRNTMANYKKFKYNWDAFVGTFRGVEALVERKAAENGVQKPKEEQKPAETAPAKKEEQKPAEPPKEEAPATNGLPGDLEKIRHDVHLLFNAGLAKQQVIDLSELFKEYTDESDEHFKAIFAKQIKESFQELAKALANEVQKRYGPITDSSIKGIIDLVKKNSKAELTSDLLVKEASNPLTRLLKKKLIKLLPTSKTAPIKLEIVDVIGEMKKLMKQMMDNLEKDLSIEELNKIIEAIEEDMDRLKRPFHVLNIFYMKDFFAKKEKQKSRKSKNAPEMAGDEELMDFVMKRKLKRELSQDLS